MRLGAAEEPAPLLSRLRFGLALLLGSAWMTCANSKGLERPGECGVGMIPGPASL